MKAKARYYTKWEDGKVQCELCAHQCMLNPGACGRCKVRYNEDGELYTAVYGEVSAMEIDPIEKKPLYHVVPGSNALSVSAMGCNFTCDFCQNWSLSQLDSCLKKGYGQEISSQQLVDTAVKNNCSSIAYTYNEPTLMLEFINDSAFMALRNDIKNVMVTNGFMTSESAECIAPFLDAVNIDLKSFSDDFYKKVCGASLKPVLDTINIFHSKGVWVELTTLIIPGLNDSEEELRELASYVASVSVDTPWHLSRFFPNYKMQDTEPTPVETIEKAVRIAKEAGLRYVYPGNVDLDSNTYCHSCETLLIKREGYTVLENNIAKHSCPNCNTFIPGLFG